MWTRKHWWVVWLLLTLPFAYEAYRLIQNDLGAQPAEALNKNFGTITVRLFLINLYLGCWIALARPSAKILTNLIPLRRPLGVACFFYCVLHFAFFFFREGDFTIAFENLLSKRYLILGLLGLIGLTALAITSNDWSVRKLKFKNWKYLHRSVYVILFLAAGHNLSIEKADLRTATFYYVPLLLLLTFRLVTRLRPRSSLANN